LYIENNKQATNNNDVLRNNPLNKYNNIENSNRDNCCNKIVEKCWTELPTPQKILFATLSICTSLVFGLVLYSLFVYH